MPEFVVVPELSRQPLSASAGTATSSNVLMRFIGRDLPHVTAKAPAGVGPVPSSHEAIVRSRLFTMPRELPSAGYRLLYSSGDPTERAAS